MLVAVVAQGEIVSHGSLQLYCFVPFSSVPFCMVLFCFVLFLVAIEQNEIIRVCSHHERLDLLLLLLHKVWKEEVWLVWHVLRAQNCIASLLWALCF